ncbi:DUF1674 domain-containing protein [Pseudochrobactrum asaccharolyticum]|uniref:DUF1674 domain-containing protein n=1 Tax=Pseudochrobactrum asaccharolyticum TaxID=354351 RepID=UPI00404387D1
MNNETASENSNVVSLADYQKSDVPAPRKKFEDLPPAAQRALLEAEARREAEQQAEAAKEIGGRGGKDPARYGDWEIKGRTIDF